MTVAKLITNQNSNAKHMILGVVFALLLVLSGGLGAASRQNAGAKVLIEDQLRTASQSVGVSGSQVTDTAPGRGTQTTGTALRTTQSLGASSSSTQTLGTGGHQETVGTAPASPVKQSSAAASNSSGTNQPGQAQEKVEAEKPKTNQPEKAGDAPQREQPAKGDGDTQELATAETLPVTGPGHIVGLFAGTSLAGFLGHKLYLRRR